MQIRPATEVDIPHIVRLLKISLGEGLMPKSESYWRWKHLQNPFGPSPVLTCWEDDTLIGVRSFIRWQWSFQGKMFKSLRAVDTATHPRHQGKGIFKKLTLALVDQCKMNGDHFIFNTPNQQSKPGYLKMGWQEAGKLPVTISVRRPVNIVKNIFVPPKTNRVVNTNSISYYLDHPQLPDLIHEHNQTRVLVTQISIRYLKWRYLNVPVAQYVAIGEEQAGRLNGLIFGRVKTSRLGNELRITDCFLKPGGNQRSLLKKIAEFKKVNAIDYCAISGSGNSEQNQMVGTFRWKGSFGPTVTIRSLSLTDLGILQNFSQWSPSIGDFELF